MRKKVVCIIALTAFAIACSCNNQPASNISTPQTDNDMCADSDAGLYKPVINAYIALAQSGYTACDENILGNDVCLTPNGSGSYFIGYDTKPALLYTFYDLNGDGTLELIIGAELGVANGAAEPSVFVTGIYGLREDEPVSLIQVEAFSQLNIFISSSGGCIIKKTSGTHIDYVEEHFYEIDRNVTLTALDKLYTYGKTNDYYNPDDITYSHTKDVDGNEVSISKQEYLALMQKYGSAGYLDTTGDLEANAVIIDSWNQLAAYK